MISDPERPTRHDGGFFRQRFVWIVAAFNLALFLFVVYAPHTTVWHWLVHSVLAGTFGFFAFACGRQLAFAMRSGQSRAMITGYVASTTGMLCMVLAELVSSKSAHDGLYSTGMALVTSSIAVFSLEARHLNHGN